MTDIRTTYTIDVNQAVSNLGRVADSQEEINQTTRDSQQIQKDASNKAVSSSNKRVKAKKQQNAELKKELEINKNIASSVDSLNRKRAASNPTKGIKQTNTLLGDQKKKMDQLGKSASNTGGLFGGLGKSLKSAFVPLLAIGGVTKLFSSSVSTIRQFGKSISELSAITGATGSDLEFYKEQAKLIGSTTTLSASEAVTAFKLLGSAKPELLKNKEALAEVTKEAITLAEASGVDLPQAAQSLAGALNQFGLDGSEASRVINALAAGSKEGAAAIPEISQALDKFGTVAAANNITVEESVGLIETLAEKNITGAEAGTKLRNVLLKLSSAEALPKDAVDELNAAGVDMNKLSDNSLSLEERLRELSKISGDSTALIKVFGAENVTAGQVLLNNVDSVAKYTKAVTGTTTANEQAATNTDNLDGALKGLSSAWEGLILEFSDGESALKGVVDSLAEFVRFVADNIDTIVTLGKVVATTLAIIGSSKSIVSFATSIQEATKGAKGFTGSIKGIGAAIASNPLGALLTAIPLIIAGFKAVVAIMSAFKTELTEAQKLSLAVKETTTALAGAFREEATEAEKVFNTLEKGNLTREESLALIEDLESVYGVYLDDLKDEEGLLTDVEAAQRRVNDSILDSIIAKQKSEQATKLLNKATSNQLSIESLNKGIIDENIKAREDFAEIQGELIKIAGSGLDAEGQRAEVQRVITQRLAGDISDIKGQLDIQEEVFAKAGENIREIFSDINLTDDLIESGKEAVGEVAEVGKAVSGERKKQRSQELKDRADFFKALDKLSEDAKSKEIALLDGAEKIQAQEEADLNEIASIRSGLELKLQALIANGQIQQDEAIAIQKRINESIDELTVGALTKSADDLRKFREDEAKKAQDLEDKILSDRLKDIEIDEQLVIESTINSKQAGFINELEFEKFKQKELQKVQLEFAKKRLAALQGAEGKEAELQRLQLQTQIDNLSRAIADVDGIAASKRFSIAKLFGVSDENAAIIDQQLGEVGGIFADNFKQLNEEQLAANQQFIQSITGRITETQQAIDTELALNEAGFASNVQGKQQELKALNEARQEALKEQEKLQKRQFLLDQLEQASSLTTAIAKFIAAESGKGLLAIPILAAIIPLVFSMFSKSKTTARNAALEKGGSGTDTGMVRGSRHTSGGENFTDHIEVEGGEAWGVLSRSASKKYGNNFHEIVQSMNSGKMHKIAEMHAPNMGIIPDFSMPSNMINQRSGVEYTRNVNIMRESFDDSTMIDKLSEIAKYNKDQAGRIESWETPNFYFIRENGEVRRFKK